MNPENWVIGNNKDWGTARYSTELTNPDTGAICQVLVDGQIDVIQVMSLQVGAKFLMAERAPSNKYKIHQ
jgi:hypothetical protein